MQLEILFKNAVLLSESVALDASIPVPVENADSEIANGAGDQDEDPVLPSTSIAFPCGSLPRASTMNGQPVDDTLPDVIESDCIESTMNPNFNFSIKFQYEQIQSLCNDLLLTKSSKCRVLIPSKDPPKKGKKESQSSGTTLFGTVLMDWKLWILSLIESGRGDIGDSTSFAVPIIDPMDESLKKGVLHLQLHFYQKGGGDTMTEWEPITALESLIPSSFSILKIHGHSLHSIPDQWHCSPDSSPQHSVSVSFQVICGGDYAETIKIDRILLEQKNENGDDHVDAVPPLLDEEWMFLVDGDALNHYIESARNGESFHVQMDHIVAVTDKKKETIVSVMDSVTLQLALRPLMRPGTCCLPQSRYPLCWVRNEENNDAVNEDENASKRLESEVVIEFQFKDPLLVPFHKTMPSAMELMQKSKIKQQHESLSVIHRETRITAAVKFQAVMAQIQEELKDKYLKMVPTFNNMECKERQNAFMKHVFSSSFGQRLTHCVAQMVAALAKEEMTPDPDAIAEELCLKLRAKLQSACDPVFASLISNRWPQRTEKKTKGHRQNKADENGLEPFLQSTNIQNVYAEPLRDINSINTLIMIALLDQHYDTAFKWQAMTICTESEQQCTLYMDLAFILSQTPKVISPSVTPQHCIREALGIKANKKILFAQILMLCEVDHLEEAEPFLNRLIEEFPNDAEVSILKGFYEHLMEEVEDAQTIWNGVKHKLQEIKKEDADTDTDGGEKEELEYQTLHELDSINDGEPSSSLFDVWAFPLRMALHFNCPHLADLLLTECKPFFQDSNEDKIDYVLLEHEVLIQRKEYEVALQCLGEAILLNDHDVRLWLNIGATYHHLGKWIDAQEALQRHCTECQQQGMEPNLMGMLWLIRIYLTILSEETQGDDGDDEADQWLQRAASVMEMCWKRIENGDILDDDMSIVSGSFDHRNVHLVEALKYKWRTLQGSYCSVIQDSASALSHYAVMVFLNFCAFQFEDGGNNDNDIQSASRIHPFDDRLWECIDDSYNLIDAKHDAMDVEC